MVKYSFVARLMTGKYAYIKVSASDFDQAVEKAIRSLSAKGYKISYLTGAPRKPDDNMLKVDEDE